MPARSILHSPMGTVKSLSNTSGVTGKDMPYRISFSRKTTGLSSPREPRSSEIGFAGNLLEPLRRWRGAQWLGLALGVPSRSEPPSAP